MFEATLGNSLSPAWTLGDRRGADASGLPSLDGSRGVILTVHSEAPSGHSFEMYLADPVGIFVGILFSQFSLLNCKLAYC